MNKNNRFRDSKTDLHLLIRRRVLKAITKQYKKEDPNKSLSTYIENALIFYLNEKGVEV